MLIAYLACTSCLANFIFIIFLTPSYALSLLHNRVISIILHVQRAPHEKRCFQFYIRITTNILLKEITGCECKLWAYIFTILLLFNGVRIITPIGTYQKPTGRQRESKMTVFRQVMRADMNSSFCHTSRKQEIL